MDFKIRKAKRKDCKDIFKLITELAVYEKAEKEVTISLSELEEAGFGKKPIWKAFVAEVDGKVVGMALYYVRYSTWKGAYLYLEDFIVTEDYRGKGIGKALFERVLYISKRDFNGMIWQVLDWNEPAINFYKQYEANFDGKWLNVTLHH